MQITDWSKGLSVEAGGRGVVPHVGAALLRLLADRSGLTQALSVAVARREFVPGRDRGRVLVDPAVMVADGGEEIADIDMLSRDLLIRGAAFQVSFLSATTVAARFGVAVVGAHQVALQLWFFTAMLLDALAIAAQSLVGAALGAGDAASARLLARQVAVFGGLCGVGFAVLIGAGAGLIPAWFSADPQVRDQALLAWPWFVAMQPLAGVVFALDGVLIGAGDVRYLRDLTVFNALARWLPAGDLAHLRLRPRSRWHLGRVDPLRGDPADRPAAADPLRALAGARRHPLTLWGGWDAGAVVGGAACRPGTT
ncbi:MATE family efflux transporter [Plantactinospora sp. DSM 117369]